MHTKISHKIASKGMMIILLATILFHFLVLLGIVPYQIVWGGRLQNQSEMINFELVSILLNFLMLAIVAIQAKIVKLKVHPIVVKIALWLMVFIFVMNTIGNIISLNDIERYIFTPLTLLLAIFSFILASKKRVKTHKK
tara:strand:- start:163 stop:579 length:417 start_codon:yes stop_codon:yes gene_type:complete